MASSSDFTSKTGNYLFQVRGSCPLRRVRSIGQGGSCFWGRQAQLAFLMFAAVVGTLSSAGCAKPVPITVPDVTGQDFEQAQKTLTAANLKPGTISGAPGPGAYVVSQNPNALQQVAANSKVDLVVKMPVQVPSLIGSSVTDAVSVLQGLGLKAAFVQLHSNNPFAKPKVESQNPAAASFVHEGGLVTLMVSTPANIEGLLGLVAKESAYQNLKPEYKKVLDAFMGNPSVSRSMADQDMPNSPSTAPK